MWLIRIFIWEFEFYSECVKGIRRETFVIASLKQFYTFSILGTSTRTSLGPTPVTNRPRPSQTAIYFFLTISAARTFLGKCLGVTLTSLGFFLTAFRNRKESHWLFGRGGKTGEATRREVLERYRLPSGRTLPSESGPECCAKL